VIIVSSRDAPGMSAAVLSEILGVPPDGLLVYVQCLDDAPSAAPTGLDDTTQPAAGGAITSLVVASSIDPDGLDVLTPNRTPPEPQPQVGGSEAGAVSPMTATPVGEVAPTDQRSVDRLNPVFTGEALVLHGPRPVTSHRPSLADFATPQDSLGRVIDAAPVRNLLGLPRLLPERGYSLGDVQTVAAALRCAVQIEPTGRVQIVGHFGCKTYGTLADAVAALNARTFNPE